VARAVSSTRDRYQASVILRAPIAAVADRVPGWVGTVEPLDDDSCLLRTGSDWLGGLAVYVAEIGVDFEVVEPPEFVERVRELAERFGRATPAAPLTGGGTLPDAAATPAGLAGDRPTDP
jgi:predicted DNA-binding transcriptional regulator YafY